MVTQIIGNLLTYRLDAFIHQSNCFLCFGSGVAKSVRETYPEVYEADCKTVKGDRSKLGTFSCAITHDNKIGYNLYSQYDFGYDGKRRTDYVAMKNGLTLIKYDLIDRLGHINRPIKVGLPYKIGCARGGGSWDEVYKIIKDVFESGYLTNYINVFICEFKEYSSKDDENIKKLRELYKNAELMGNTTENNED